MSKVHKNGEIFKYKGHTLKYDKHLGWVYKEGDHFVVVYAYTIEDVKKITI
jgi:hypothetical protein